jgi:hypothetical protein
MTTMRMMRSYPENHETRQVFSKREVVSYIADYAPATSRTVDPSRRRN